MFWRSTKRQPRIAFDKSLNAVLGWKVSLGTSLEIGLKAFCSDLPMTLKPSLFRKQSLFRLGFGGWSKGPRHWRRKLWTFETGGGSNTRL